MISVCLMAVSFSQCCVDAAVGHGLIVIEAIGADPEQDLDTVPSPLRHSGSWDARASHRETAACRRSYGLPASGDATWSGVRASVRASAQTPVMAVEATGCPRSPLKTRPSAATPKVSIWSWRIATSSDGIGTVRVSSSGRCFRPRSAWAELLSAQRRLTSPRLFERHLTSS
jgi:hypothetical protein